MKKTYLLEGLDCANCAAEIERAVAARCPRAEAPVRVAVAVDAQQPLDLVGHGVEAAVVHVRSPFRLHGDNVSR